MLTDGKIQCALSLPEGVLTVKRPMNGAVNARSELQAKVNLQSPLLLRDCSGPLPNWNLQLEAQTTFVGTDNDAHSIQRQPLAGRTELSYLWKFTPEEEVKPYSAHIWLRLVVLDGVMEIDRWNLFYHEFPFANLSFFGVSADLALTLAGVLAVVGGLVFWISCLTDRRGKSETNHSDFA